MAELNPSIVFQGAGGIVPDYAKSEQQAATLKGTGLENIQRGLQNTRSQQEIDQTTYDVNFRKTLDDLLAKHTRPANQPVNPSASPIPPADDKGKPTGTMQPQSAGDNGRPSLAVGDQPNPTGPGASAEPLPPGVLGYALDGHAITDHDDLVADTMARNKLLEPDGKTAQPASSGLPGETVPASAAPVSSPSPVDNGNGSSQPQAAQTPGGFITDMRSIQKELADAGYGSKALAMNPALMEAAVKGIDLQTKQFDLIAKQHGQMASLAAGVMRNQVNPNEPDPVKLDAQKNMFVSAAQSAVKTGLEQGVIDQAHAAPLLAEIGKGWSPQLQQDISGLMDAAQNSVALHTSVSDSLKEARESILKGEDIKEKTTANAMQSLSAVTDQAGYDQWLKDNPEQAKTAPATFSPSAVMNLLKKAVPVKEQPEFEIKVNQLAAQKNTSPQAWDSQVDAAVPPGSNALLNSRTKALVKSAVALGDFKGAQSAIKDASDQIGRTETAVATAKATAPIKISVNQAEASSRQNLNAAGTTADDYKRAGEEYAITGVMPSLGRDSVSRNKILHASMEYQRDNGLTPKDIVMAHAAYKGDTGALNAMIKNRSQINAFEETAGKNLDNFLDLAGKVVDSGSPWLNKPLRSISDKGLGSEDLAALNAARAVATNEVAKVTSGGSMSGVLSDAARSEVKDYNPSNATFKQTLAVVKVLRKDMQNRHDALDNAVTRLRGSVGNETSNAGAGSGTPSTPNQPVATKRYNPKTGQIETK